MERGGTRREPEGRVVCAPYGPRKHNRGACARVVAGHQSDLPTFFKRYQIQPVWRADRPAKGRFREFYQCDIDSIGSTSLMVEAEQLAAVAEIFKLLGFSDFRILLNHRHVLTGLLEVAEIPTEQRETALVALDKLDKIGDQGVAAEFVARGIDQQKAVRLLNMLRDIYDAPMGGQASPNASRLESLRHFIGDSEHKDAVEEVAQIVRLVSATPAAGHVFVDPRLARGLSYYTGSIVEVTVPELNGSLGGGGRYDKLIGMFLGRDLPACGFSLGLERIIVVMTEREMFPPQLVSSPADVMVSIWNEESVGDSIALAQELRSAGLRVDLYPEADKLGKQFKYASGRDILFVVVIGDEERERGEVAIKDLRSGEQQSVKRETLAQAIRAGLQAT